MSRADDIASFETPMTDASERSLGDDATFAGSAKRQRADVSIGDERTLGDGLSGQETIIDDIEVVDLEARYKIEGTLGQGGMGAVLLATDTRLDRKVAIKRILGEAAGNRMAVTRFLTEAKSIAALNHPNIVQIYDYGRAKDGPFLIMEFVDEGSLLDRCRDGAMPLESAIDLACQLCDGLAKAHDLGIIHRDIKPANVLLTKDGTPKLTDFGLAKAQAGDHGQTMTGAVLGTPDFMPPEQRRDASLVDHRSDLWSLAATVYQMATGRSPKIIRFDLLPPELTKVLGKALEDAKDDRYQTARELRDALKASLRAATPDASAIAQGQCPSCGVQNDASRRFCRGCGGSLEAPCLSCDKPMPLGEEICGSCGAKQSPLLESRRSDMAAAQVKAEGLLGDLDFANAADIATRLRDEAHPKLSHLKEWAAPFLAKVENVRQHQVQRAADDVADAMRHEQAYDYLSAIFTLEMLPRTVHQQPLPGTSETVASALARLKSKQAESLRLDSLIKQRISAKQLTGLLPEVERLLELQPTRPELLTVKKQLEERQSRLVTTRDSAVAKANQLVAGGEYETALKVLGQIDPTTETSQSRSLRSRCEKTIDKVRELADTIRTSIAHKRYDGLLATVETFLALRPRDADAEKIRQSLLQRQEKLGQRLESAVRQAKDFMRACDFEQAVGLLRSVINDPFAESCNAVEKQLTSAQLLLTECETLAIGREAAVSALDNAMAHALYADGPVHAQTYQQQLEARGIRDADVDNRVERCRERLAKQRRTQMLSRGGLIAGGVATALIFLGVLWNAMFFDSRAGTAVETRGDSAAAAVPSAKAPGRVQPDSTAKGMPTGGQMKSISDLYYGAQLNSIGMKFINVPAGEAYISTKKMVIRTDRGESPRSGRRETIERPFLISQTEVTQGQWRRVMNTEPWKGKSPDAPTLPVTFVTRDDAVAFCTALTNLDTGVGRKGVFGNKPLGRPCTVADISPSSGLYSLPTDIQWDYACKGSSQSGIDVENLGPYAWSADNCNQALHDVAMKRANRIGVYDMHGNAQELTMGLTRGGSWKKSQGQCGSDRIEGQPNHVGPSDDVGFRVIVELGH
jgi:formylglycine-generating enzyme required for sulfatase activity